MFLGRHYAHGFLIMASINNICSISADLLDAIEVEPGFKGAKMTSGVVLC